MAALWMGIPDAKTDSVLTASGIGNGSEWNRTWEVKAANASETAREITLRKGHADTEITG